MGTSTPENTKILSYLLVWKVCAKAQFPRSFGLFPKTLRKLCVSTKFPHQQIRYNYGILCTEGCAYLITTLLQYYSKFFITHKGLSSFGFSSLCRSFLSARYFLQVSFKNIKSHGNMQTSRWKLDQPIKKIYYKDLYFSWLKMLRKCLIHIQIK